MKHYTLAREAWDACASMRASRTRFKKYAYGRQWDDPVRMPDGRWATEGEYARLSGKEPLTNNMIRQLLKSVVGRFRHDLAQRTAQPSADALRNQLDELDARMLEEFLISGCAVQRVVREQRPDAAGRRVWVDNVSPAAFFVNHHTDPRGSDVETIGMLHSLTLDQVVMRYAHDDPARRRHIVDTYSRLGLGADRLPITGLEAAPSFDTAPRGRCRVVEVWRRIPCEALRCHDRASGRAFTLDALAAPALEAENARRAAASMPLIHSHPSSTLAWHGYCYAPGGVLLDDTPSPYPHASHPFAFRLYPLTDGEVHPFVEDIIDQQRYINRLITLIDHVMSFSAKGVLLFPENQKPEGASWADIAHNWCRPNGVIPYRNAGSTPPTQMYSSPNTSEAYQLLGIELKLLEQISGVSGALAGQAPSAATGAQLYQAQLENAAIALLDIFETFNTFRSHRDRLMSLA